MMQPLSSSIRRRNENDPAPVRAVMATAAALFFVPESLAPNTMSRFRVLGELQAFYERIPNWRCMVEIWGEKAGLLLPIKMAAIAG